MYFLQEFPAIDPLDSRLVLAIESGGGSTRIALADGHGHLLRRETCGSASPLYRDGEEFSKTLRSALAEVLGDSLSRVRLAGLAGPADHPLVARALGEIAPDLELVDFSEGDLARGMHGLSTGVALIAGTGCHCSAVDAEGRVTTLGGYGPQFGDEGSGYWIGLQGLKSAFRAEQGREGSIALLDVARAHYGVASPWELLSEAGGGGHVPAPRIAEFAPHVDRLGKADEAARAILECAGAHLAELVLETARVANLSVSPVPLAMSGGALRSATLLAALEGRLSEGAIDFTIHPAIHEPLGGLVALLQRACEQRNP